MINTKRTTVLMCVCFSMFVLPFQAASDEVILAYSPSLSFAPLFIAIEKGYLKEEGIEIRLELFKSGSEAVAFAANGQIAGIAGGIGASNFNGAFKNMGVKIVAPMAIQPTKGAPAPILVRSDLVKEIKSPKDLKGKRIAVGGGAGATGEYMLLRVLEKEGIEKKDVTLVNLAFPDMPLAFSKKSVDAGLVPAPFSIVPLEEGTARILVPVCTPGEMVTVLSFGEKFMEKNPKSAEGMVTAIMKATRDLVRVGRYTDDFIAIFLKYYKVDREKLVKIDLYDFDPDLKIQEKTLREMERVFAKNGLLDYQPPLPIDKLVETSFSTKALQKLGPFRR
ncbi:MAG TPA: ABC transporter substrate-binding protein [Thermodesulfobacteriota bacterium]|nr:ABC transporter substrate-binding protein [Thermodesulfobacteriota bacterium]